MKKRTIFLTAEMGSLLVVAYVCTQTNQNVSKDTQGAIQPSKNVRFHREASYKPTDRSIPTKPSHVQEDRVGIPLKRTTRTPHPLGTDEARNALGQAMTQTRFQSLRSLKSSALPLPASMVIADQPLTPHSEEESLLKLAQQFQKDIGKEITFPRTDTMDANSWFDAKEQSDLQFRIRYGKQAWLSHHIAAQHLLQQEQEH